MSFWISTDQCNPAVWITLFTVIAIGFNFFDVRRYGEIEYWLTVIRIAVIIGFIILGLLLPMTASTAPRLLGIDSKNELTPCDDPASVDCVSPPGFFCTQTSSALLTPDWRENPFNEYIVTGSLGRLAAFWACCCHACYAFGSLDILGITAVEVERPRQTLPRATRRVATRIISYYLCLIFVLGLNLSPDDPKLHWLTENSSYIGPFTLLVQRAGLSAFGNVAIAITVEAAISTGAINLYVAVVLFAAR
jgi:amino acid transporter